ncbi:hypothetical protein Poli38472_011073 [Pythium oligandrum]|uniref:DUF4833 domain-containing protein n=1 Tax=Pythium oligandrum TaxID=41045 RepID=A0A8K1FRC5_PYTOL|nr:hypothetical protein Poli38472_011073 [Pythium oligandrum]|eukprot:TMW67453.1 hypothetical protein Poli38472_011073 [Pythium oligandrum]
MLSRRNSVHVFTDEYPDKDYKPTTASTHTQTKFWPAYLPVNDDRLFIFERSKNAQLVVYTANYADKEKRLLDDKWPLDINWQSFGWTAQPTTNGTGVMERKLAWGYSHKALDGSNNDQALVTGASYGSQFQVTLNALPSRAAHLYFDAKGRLILQTTINETPSRLWKIYVCTNNSMAFIPKVLYVDLYGTSVETGQETYERINVSA